MAIVKEKDEMLLKLSGLYREVADLIDEMNLLQCTEGETPEEKEQIEENLNRVIGKFLLKSIEIQKLQISKG